MDEIKIGEEYWTWIKPQNRSDIPIVKRVIIRDVFTVMVTTDVAGSAWSLDVPKDELYLTQEGAMKALQRNLDKEKL